MTLAVMNSRLGGKGGRKEGAARVPGHPPPKEQLRLHDINQHFSVGFCCPAKFSTWEARQNFLSPPAAERFAGLWAGRVHAPIYILLALGARKVISNHNTV